MLWALDHVAVTNLSQFGGRYREEPVYVGNHVSPHFRDVPELMDRFISSVHENWFIYSPTELAAYALWRINWIHPFIDGNGRTARRHHITCFAFDLVPCCEVERSSRNAVNIPRQSRGL
jgi:hypothetical protein